MGKSLVQATYLASGKLIVSALVFISHPSMIFISSIFPSHASFFRERMSSCGIGSAGSVGLLIRWTANGMAAAHHLALSPMSGHMGGMSSM